MVVLPRNDRDEAEAAALRLLLDGDTTVDAIAAMSDELALGVLQAARRLGTEVPAQLAVTGWDDSASAASAGLTTIAQSLRDQGERCARFVVESDTTTTGTPPSWELVIRESSAQPGNEAQDRRDGRRDRWTQRHQREQERTRGARVSDV